MNTFLTVFQIIVSVLLITAILLQAKGTGLGSAWGGGGETYRSKRGVERILQLATIILTVIFLITAIIKLLL